MPAYCKPHTQHASATIYKDAEVHPDGTQKQQYTNYGTGIEFHAKHSRNPVLEPSRQPGLLARVWVALIGAHPLASMAREAAAPCPPLLRRNMQGALEQGATITHRCNSSEAGNCSQLGSTPSFSSPTVRRMCKTAGRRFGRCWPIAPLQMSLQLCTFSSPHGRVRPQVLQESLFRSSWGAARSCMQPLVPPTHLAPRLAGSNQHSIAHR